MEQSTIDIGITVNATLYLHELTNDNEACRIDAKDVEGVSKNDNGETVVQLKNPNGESHSIVVTENSEDVETAVANALYYRKEALDRIKSLLQG